jgi:putative nucleotidyltransferase with HDIG domain
MPQFTPLPPERIAEWLASVDEAALWALDEQLRGDLLTIGQDGRNPTPLRASAGTERSPVTENAQPTTGFPRDTEPMRALYASAVAAAEALWNTAATQGSPDLPAATRAIDGLASSVTSDLAGVVALANRENVGDYTFTHMVNVAILTMGQARTLGIDGQLLRDVGLAALLHDIGKVLTPVEILRKPERLTDAEFRIMQRHTVDGAEMLRRIPDMPTLAPVVAFEHHLRLDGSGYPETARREQLNVATMLCSIADVYDAMRAQRTYQPSFPTDRILAVLQGPGRPQFDQQLVQRFVELLGIHPSGRMASR